MTNEMTTRKRTATGGPWKRHNYRYRRFQALSDALDLYFALRDVRGTWLNVDDLCDELELDAQDHSVRKRVRRMGEALKRVHRIEMKRASGRFVMFRCPRVV